MKVIKLVQTCEACPSQWEGVTDDNRQIYVRYRWGYLSVRVSRPGATDVVEAVRGEEIFGDQRDGSKEVVDGIAIGSFDGYLTYEELKEATKGVIEFPERME